LRLEFIGGTLDGPANSLGHAKRCALRPLAGAGAQLGMDVQMALRSK
jgi:hypothetical protein